MVRSRDILSRVETGNEGWIMENGKGISLGDIGKFRSVISNLAKDEYKLYAPFQMRRQAEHAKGWGQVVTPLTSAENHFSQMVKMVRMGSTELAANLFRATQTEEKIRRENIKGKAKANQIHYEVGAKVRQTIKDLGGDMPDDLPTPKQSVKQLEREQKKVKGRKG
jgi:hypothetical protein